MGRTFTKFHMSLRYMEMLKTSFHAAVQEINFAAVRGAKPDSYSHSNQEEDERQNKGPDKARPLWSVFVLINAIYVKAKWKYVPI